MASYTGTAQVARAGSTIGQVDPRRLHSWRGLVWLAKVGLAGQPRAGEHAEDGMSLQAKLSPSGVWQVPHRRRGTSMTAPMSPPRWLACRSRMMTFMRVAVRSDRCWGGG